MSDLNVLPGVVTEVIFDRPTKKNALTAGMYGALADALRAANADPDVRVLLVSGAQGVFTAGNDLVDFLEQPPSGEDSPVFRMLRALADFRKPLVAAVDGPAIGFGTTLLLHCDLVYASERARFQLPFVNLGLTPEGASSVLLPLLVGQPKAAEWLYFGEPFSAQEALSAGLINAVLPPEGLMTHARERCSTLSGKPSEALFAARELLRAPHRPGVHAALGREGTEFVARLGSDAARLAFARFLRR